MSQSHTPIDRPALPAATVRMAEILRGRGIPQGLSETPLPGVRYMRTDEYRAPQPLIYDPGLCIIASGRKTVRLGGESYVYDADTFLVLGVPLPVECEVHATPDDPVLGIRVDVDPVVLAELLLDVADAGLAATAPPPPGIYASRLPGAMRDACLRLIQTFESPADARILGPAIVREILYRALSTEQAGALRAVATQHARFRQISRALHRIHAEYDRDLSVEDLARDVHMSASSFHESFRAVTATSPLQYLKAIRLHRARTLMVQDGVGAAVAATRVGYESPSQFSREFKRLFGSTPANEASRARAAVAPA